MTTTSKKNVPNIRFPEFENSGEWVEKKLDNIGTFFRGHSYSKKDVSTEDNGNTIVLRSNNIDEYRINYNDLQYVTKKCRKEIIVKNNDIIICMSNGSANLVGKNAYIRYDKIPHDKKIDDKDITVGAFCGIYRTENQIVKYFFQSDFYKKQLQTLFAGSNINNLKGTDILSMYIYTPTSSQEQKKIADFMSSVDELINNEKIKLEKLIEYKKGLLQNLFPKENQKVPDLRFPEFKNSGEWEEKKLGDISYYISSNYSVSSALEQGKYYLYDANKLIGFTNEYLCDRDYISIIKDGSGVGRTRYMNAYNNIIGTMGCIVPNNNINSYFLYSLINNINFKQYIKGATIPHIYYSDYSKHIVFIPPLKEQEKIADFLSSLDELINEQDNKIKLLHDYKKSLLQQLFPN